MTARDPFPHSAGLGEFLHPMAKDNASGIPRHRWQEQVNPDLAGLQPSGTDALRYESFRRAQTEAVGMALRLAEKVHAETEEGKRVLRRARPEIADPAASGPSTAQPQNAVEEAERAAKCRERLLSLDKGYEMTVSFTGTFIRDAGNNPVQEFAYVITQNGYPQHIGDVVSCEQFAHKAWMDVRDQQQELDEVAKRTRAPVTATVVVLGDGDDDLWPVPDPHADEIAELKARLAALEAGR